jgi:hypothetical protein
LHNLNRASLLLHYIWLPYMIFCLEYFGRTLNNLNNLNNKSVNPRYIAVGYYSEDCSIEEKWTALVTSS